MVLVTGVRLHMARDGSLVCVSTRVAIVLCVVSLGFLASWVSRARPQGFLLGPCHRACYLLPVPAGVPCGCAVRLFKI